MAMAQLDNIGPCENYHSRAPTLKKIMNITLN